MNFSGKWTEQENTILSEETQTQKNNYHLYSLIRVFNHKAKKTSLQITIPENLDNNEYSETYVDLIYMGSRKRQDLLSKLGAWGSWERVKVHLECTGFTNSSEKLS